MDAAFNAGGATARRDLLQLDRVPPFCLLPAPHSGTADSPSGVDTNGGGMDARSAERSDPRRVATRLWVVLALACLGLLGQGERFHVDARFRSPKATLLTYWE